MPSLSERIAAANRCAVRECQRARTRESLFCTSHLNEMWASRLLRQPDGSYVPVRFRVAKEVSPA